MQSSWQLEGSLPWSQPEQLGYEHLRRSLPCSQRGDAALGTLAAQPAVLAAGVLHWGHLLHSLPWLQSAGVRAARGALAAQPAVLSAGVAALRALAAQPAVLAVGFAALGTLAAQPAMLAVSRRAALEAPAAHPAVLSAGVAALRALAAQPAVLTAAVLGPPCLLLAGWGRQQAAAAMLRYVAEGRRRGGLGLCYAAARARGRRRSDGGSGCWQVIARLPERVGGAGAWAFRGAAGWLERRRADAAGIEMPFYLVIV
jgi:hypothetical protein